MKGLRSYTMFCSVIFCLLMLIGCLSAPNLKMSESLPPIVKEYKHFTLYGGNAGMKKTGVYLSEGDMYSILATGSIDYCPKCKGKFDYHNVRPEDGWPLMARVGKGYFYRPFYRGMNASTDITQDSGDLYLGYRCGDIYPSGEPKNPDYYVYDSGSFNVDIIVWEKEDWIQIADFFEKMKEKYPQNSAIINAFDQANRKKDWHLASKETSEEVEKTKKELQKLKEEPKEEKEQVVKTTPEEKPTPQAKGPKAALEKQEIISKAKTAPAEKPTPVAKTSAPEAGKQERIAQLEVKLANLMESLAKLDEMRRQFEEEKEKSSLLTKKLEEREKIEQELIFKLKHGAKAPPVIVIASPKDESKVEINIIQLSGVAEDDQGLARVEIFINRKPLKKMKDDRGIMVTGKKNPKRLDIKELIPLEKGINRIMIRAVDDDGLTSEKILAVQYVERRKNIWAVVIGINNYPNIRHLKYAVNDARIFYDHLVNYNHIPAENVTLLIDQEATLTRVRSTLGTHLKSKAGKDDMAIIFFAGHGATEKDVMSPDGDGLEKYLLPYDANPKDLYATALPMGEVSRIFNRIRSERLVFFADSCYSGASGGRTIGITGLRANISEAFLDRIASGKGRVIMTASGANEVSAEKDDLQQGVFTYYLVQGLRGKADADKDGLITVDELYRYVSDQVPLATGQEQHPVKKGTVKGRLILGVTNPHQ